MRWWSRGGRHDPEIAPDEIFLDATNTPSFDQARFEGRLERPLGRSTLAILGGVLGVVFLILLGQLWNLQIYQGAAYAAESTHNSLSSHVLFADRGIITDRSGVALVTNEEGLEGHTIRRYLTPGFGSVLGYVSYPKKDTDGNYYV